MPLVEWREMEGKEVKYLEEVKGKRGKWTGTELNKYKQLNKSKHSK